MRTYILMTKLSPEVAAKMRDREKIGQRWLVLVRN